MMVKFSHNLYDWLDFVDLDFHGNMLIGLLFNIAKMPGTVVFLSAGSMKSSYNEDSRFVFVFHVRLEFVPVLTE